MFGGGTLSVFLSRRNSTTSLPHLLCSYHQCTWEAQPSTTTLAARRNQLRVARQRQSANVFVHEGTHFPRGAGWTAFSLRACCSQARGCQASLKKKAQRRTIIVLPAGVPCYLVGFRFLVDEAISVRNFRTLSSEIPTILSQRFTRLALSHLDVTITLNDMPSAVA